MAELWKPQSPAVYQHWVNTIINEAQDKLSSWEIDFIGSIDLQLAKRMILTQSQAEKLESIYSEKTS